MKARFPRVGDRFPDVELDDHTGARQRLSSWLTPSLLDRHLGFDQGYPLIVQFIRGPFCPRDQHQLRGLVAATEEFVLNGCSIVIIAVQPPEVMAAFRAGLGATFPFLSDVDRRVIGDLGIVDETEGEYARVSRPMTVILDERRVVHRVYDGWWSAGRPSVEELRRDIREVMSATRRWPYAAWTEQRVTNVRVPQERWASETVAVPGRRGCVAWFDVDRGVGEITVIDEHERLEAAAESRVFFHFTAVPGSGERRLAAGALVSFDMMSGPAGPFATRVVPDR